MLQTCAHHGNLGGGGALSQLGHADGRRQQRVDARVGGKFGRESMPTCWAGLLALRHPVIEAAQAEIVLAGRLAGRQPRQYQFSVGGRESSWLCCSRQWHAGLAAVQSTPAC